MSNLAQLIAPVVATYDDAKILLDAAKTGGFAYPAVNVENPNTITATLEAARKVFYKSNSAYLQPQIGKPDGDDKPNKKFYDPRV